MSEETIHAVSQPFPPLFEAKIHMLTGIEADQSILKDKVLFKHVASEAADGVSANLMRERGKSLERGDEDFLEGLAAEAFRMSAVVEGSDRNYRLGKLAFAYGLTETVGGRMQGKEMATPPTKADVEAFDKIHGRALDIVVPAITKFLGMSAIEARETLETIHQTRMMMLREHPAKRPLWRQYLHKKMDVIAAPLYTYAKINGYGIANPEVARLGIGHQDLLPQGNVLIEEVQRAAFNLIHGETPPFDPTLEDLQQRQIWSRMTALGKDKFMLQGNALSGAFLFGNYVMGEVTGNPDYGQRMLASTQTKVADFFADMPIDEDMIVSENVPKSVWGALDKALVKEGVSKVTNKQGEEEEKIGLGTQLRELYEQCFPDEDVGAKKERLRQLGHTYYFIAMVQKLHMFADIVRYYFEKPQAPQRAAVEQFLLDVQKQIAADVYDVHRTRGYVWDFEDMDPPGQNFDALCQQALADDPDALTENPNTFIIFDAWVEGGASEFRKVSLAQVSARGSVYEQVDKWYEDHIHIPGIRRVFAGVVVKRQFSDTRTPGELQCIPMKDSLLAWQSRLNFKFYREGEEHDQTIRNSIESPGDEQ